jgi:2-keto-4-pentenoate hydratase
MLIETDKIARQLREAAETGVPIAPPRKLYPDAGVEDAYAVQDANTRHWQEKGRRLVGSKIGLTSRAVQDQLGVKQPDFGMLFSDMAVGEGLEIPFRSVLQPRVEVEIAFVLDRDLDLVGATAADVMRATAYVVPAIEVVGSRVAGWDIGLFDTIADNASSGAYVLGGPARRLTGLDLRGCRMSLKRGDDVVSSGAGAACLGHPINAVAWLASTLAGFGRPLRAGDTILSGALGPLVAVNPGDAFSAEISGLGTVATVFGPQE